MIDRKQEVTDAEKAAADLLSGAPAASDASILDTTKKVEDSRAASNQTIADVARETAAKYGAPGNAGAGAAPGIERGNEDLASANEDAMALRKVRERQDNVNRTFNNVFSQMLTATGNKELAAKTAMQFALDEDRRTFQSNQNEKARSVTMKKQTMLDQFAQQKIDQTRKAQADARHKALVNSMMRSFFGMAGTVVGASVAGPWGAAVGNQVGNAVGVSGDSSQGTTGDFTGMDDLA